MLEDGGVCQLLNLSLLFDCSFIYASSKNFFKQFFSKMLLL